MVGNVAELNKRMLLTHGFPKETNWNTGSWSNLLEMRPSKMSELITNLENAVGRDGMKTVIGSMAQPLQQKARRDHGLKAVPNNREVNASLDAAKGVYEALYETKGKPVPKTRHLEGLSAFVKLHYDSIFSSKPREVKGNIVRSVCRRKIDFLRMRGVSNTVMNQWIGSKAGREWLLSTPAEEMNAINQVLIRENLAGLFPTVMSCHKARKGSSINPESVRSYIQKLRDGAPELPKAELNAPLIKNPVIFAKGAKCLSGFLRNMPRKRRIIVPDKPKQSGRRL